MHFALADTRGGFGCVAEVWQVFASQFAQVIGVAGNDDNVRQVSRGQGALLDGDWVTMGPLCVGGTGLIMGHSSKPGPGRMGISWIGSKLWQKPDRTFSSCTKAHLARRGNRGSR